MSAGQTIFQLSHEPRRQQGSSVDENERPNATPSPVLSPMSLDNSQQSLDHGPEIEPAIRHQQNSPRTLNHSSSAGFLNHSDKQLQDNEETHATPVVSSDNARSSITSSSASTNLEDARSAMATLSSFVAKGGLNSFVDKKDRTAMVQFFLMLLQFFQGIQRRERYKSLVYREIELRSNLREVERMKERLGSQMDMESASSDHQGPQTAEQQQLPSPQAESSSREASRHEIDASRQHETDADRQEEPQRKRRRLNYSKCTFCRKDKKAIDRKRISIYLDWTRQTWEVSNVATGDCLPCTIVCNTFGGNLLATNPNLEPSSLPVSSRKQEDTPASIQPHYNSSLPNKTWTPAEESGIKQMHNARRTWAEVTKARTRSSRYILNYNYQDVELRPITIKLINNLPALKTLIG
ncbi:hypothetical protein M406DRAFT_73988 [Cryphonectria parasitica EP155]|uniref:Uncharacterized protein n=1 Tax=Cryphonectria parasitica (strain ATCC 38755 / EP155) TaxID=660469 RepID=A0A9P4XXW8_CRYP1|nr:uncharacterized protein M406DRAFT_73988 [Cryphonectria parasitica EP155]KAF3763372.1 hypothetical protein M406DRAFT_73988 [Cryphonectria parasitica EP155]